MTPEKRRRLVGAILAMLWLVAFIVADVAVTNPTLSLAPLFAIAPLIACAVLPAGPTTVFGVAALLLAAWSNQWNDAWGTPQVWVRLVDIFLVSAAAVMVAWVRVRRERQLARVARIAEVAQRTVLPLIPRRVGPLTAGARYLSAAEDTLVGGDLYDWFRSDRRICFVVGDVRGKGVGAVEQAARVIRAFRQSAAAGADLAAMAAQMSDYLMQFFDDEEFVTAVLVADHEHHAADAGQLRPPGAHLRPDAMAARPSSMPPVGLPLGLGEHVRRPSACRGLRVTGCCCTPTASARPATGRTSSCLCLALAPLLKAPSRRGRARRHTDAGARARPGRAAHRRPGRAATRERCPRRRILDRSPWLPGSQR